MGYSVSMQKRAEYGASMAKKYGGYSALIRISNDSQKVRAAGGTPKLKRDPLDGTYYVTDPTGCFYFDPEFPRYIYWENGWWWTRENGGEKQFYYRSDAVEYLGFTSVMAAPKPTSPEPPKRTTLNE